MRKWAKSTARAALLTAGFVALGSGGVLPATVLADTNGDGSVLGGNQVNLPISIPIDASGNAVAVGGLSTAGSKGGASVRNGGAGGSGTGQHTSGKHSIAGGNQVYAPIGVPVNVCGNAVAILGAAGAGCEGGSSVKNKGGGAGQHTSGKHSIAGGNQVYAPISVPVNVCGNAVAVLGDAAAFCKGGASVKNKGGGAAQHTSGKHSIAGGNQVKAPISVPVNVCGNAVAVIGAAAAFCKGGAEVSGKPGGHPDWHGGYPGHPGGGGVCGPCGGGHGGGGYYEGSGTSGQPDLLQRNVPSSPVADGLTEKVRFAPGSALPALPGLPAGAPALPELPVGAPALPGQGAGETVETTPTTPRTAPSASGLRSADQPPVPGQPGVPVGTGDPTDDIGSLTGQADAATGEAGVVTGAVGTAAGDAGALKDEAVAVTPMAATEPIAGRPGFASMSLVLLGGLLAGAAAITAFARRVRTGRR